MYIRSLISYKLHEGALLAVYFRRDLLGWLSLTTKSVATEALRLPPNPKLSSLGFALDPAEPEFWVTS